MARYPFLSDEWLQAAHQLREEFADRVPAVTVAIRMNQVIKDVPFRTDPLELHVDTSSGLVELELGLLEKPDLTLTLNYETAKAILVEGDFSAVMSAFLGGRIKVDGDITKMMALQNSGAVGSKDPVGAEFARRVQQITE